MDVARTALGIRKLLIKMISEHFGKTHHDLERNWYNGSVPVDEQHRLKLMLFMLTADVDRHPGTITFANIEFTVEGNCHDLPWIETLTNWTITSIRGSCSTPVFKYTENQWSVSITIQCSDNNDPERNRLFFAHLVRQLEASVPLENFEFECRTRLPKSV